MTTVKNRPQPINPFEESNKFRLEKSILSPNIFHSTNTNTSTPEKDSIWNIDQRAILYPVDIPTDELSLIPQYLHDSKFNKQISAAVETFWTQHKTVIESPATISTASSISSAVKLKKLAQPPPLTTTTTSTTTTTTNNNIYSPCEIHETTVVNKTSRDQACQTMLTFPNDFDLYKIPFIQQFINNNNYLNNVNSNTKLTTIESNEANSIRKNLFEKYSDDSTHGEVTPRKNTPNFSETDLKMSIVYKEQYSSNLMFKFPLPNDNDLSSTPELSPCFSSSEHVHFEFKNTNYSPINKNQDNSHFSDHEEFSSPNLSPIKDDSIKQFSTNKNDLKDNSDIIAPKAQHQKCDCSKNGNDTFDTESYKSFENLNNSETNHVNNNMSNMSSKSNNHNESICNNSKNMMKDLSINNNNKNNCKKEDDELKRECENLNEQNDTDDSDNNENNANNNANNNNTNNNNNNNNETKLSREFSVERFNSNSEINTSKPFIMMNLCEITANQDQDTGYQTGGSTTQFNMMDTTNYQESTSMLNNNINHNTTNNSNSNMLQINNHNNNNNNSSSGNTSVNNQNFNRSNYQKEQNNYENTTNTSSNRALLSNLSLNMDSFKCSRKPQVQFLDEEKHISIFKESSTLSLPPLGNLYPLGSSTPEKSKPFIHLNESYNEKDLSYQSANVICSNQTIRTNNSYLDTINRSLFTTIDEKVEDNEKLKSTAVELDSSFMENSILKFKMPPSEYAKLVIQKAMQDLNESKNIKLKSTNI